MTLTRKREKNNKIIKKSFWCYIKEIFLKIIQIIIEKIGMFRHYCNNTCKWTHHIRYTALLLQWTKEPLYGFFKNSHLFYTYYFLLYYPRTKKNEVVCQKVFRIYRMFVLWLKLPTGRGSPVLIPLNSSFRTQQGTPPDSGLETGWYLPHPFSSTGLKMESIYFIILGIFSRELPNW